MILQRDSNLAGVVFSQEALWPDALFRVLNRIPEVIPSQSLKSFDYMNPLFKVLNPFSDSSREFKNLDLDFSKTL